MPAPFVITRTILAVAGCVILAASAALAQAPPAPLPPAYGPGAEPPAGAVPGPDSRGSDRRDWSGPDGGRGGARGDGGSRERRQSGVAACRADMQDLCGSVPGGRGARLQCLIENRDRVSPDCADMLAAIEGREPRGQRRADRGPERRDSARDGRKEERPDDRRFGDRRAEGRPFEDRRPFGREQGGNERGGGPRLGQACRADAQSLCGTVERGNARRQCLQQNEAQLSQPCREALAAMTSRRSEFRQ